MYHYHFCIHTLLYTTHAVSHKQTFTSVPIISYLTFALLSLPGRQGGMVYACTCVLYCFVFYI